MNPHSDMPEDTGHFDEQPYMKPLTNGGYSCDWSVDGASRCGYKSMKGNVKRHIRVVHFSIRFVALLRHGIQPLHNLEQTVWLR